MRYGFGIDIGGTKCAVLAGGKEKGKTVLLQKKVFDTKKIKDPSEMIEQFVRAIQDMSCELGIRHENTAGIGISCGGPLNSREKVILNPPNLAGWINIPIGDILEERLGLPVILENDANACAVAEWKYGAGRGCKNIVFLTFGTGLGAGLILDGRLYRGTNDMAGEVGHVRLTEGGPVGFGKMGSFEGYCSGGGIEQVAQMMVLEQMQQGIFPRLCVSGASLNAKYIAEMADEGDSLALEIYATSGKYLGKGLSVLIDILNPEVIIIGSIFERSRYLLWPYAEKELKKESLEMSRSVCRIVSSELGDHIGDYAALSLLDM